MSKVDTRINLRRMRTDAFSRHRSSCRRWLGPALFLGVAACMGTPPTTIQVQGTVHRVGSRLPIPGAEVTIEWPGVLGGGQSTLRADGNGRFAVGRTRRRRPDTCAGLAITVQAPDYASAYLRHEADCGDNVLTFDFALLPQPR
ncbi:MAG: hypothetical protein HY560_04070 [Gemmatimonadetes bacterium]|nr:hypothetical protein [Gemmatimonadota bacterium]